MKIKSFFVALILGLLISPNVYSEDILFEKIDKIISHSKRRVVLWRIYTTSLDSNIQMQVTVDSVLKEDFNSKEKFLLHGKEKLNELRANTYYLILTIAGCDTEENRCDSRAKRFWLLFPGIDNLLLDTPENRRALSKKFDKMEIKYDMRSSDWGGMGNIRKKGTREKKPDVEK
jgi:hypothetical protein